MGALRKHNWRRSLTTGSLQTSRWRLGSQRWLLTPSQFDSQATLRTPFSRPPLAPPLTPIAYARDVKHASTAARSDIAQVVHPLGQRVAEQVQELDRCTSKCQQLELQTDVADQPAARILGTPRLAGSGYMYCKSVRDAIVHATLPRHLHARCHNKSSKDGAANVKVKGVHAAAFRGAPPRGVGPGHHVNTEGDAM